MPAAEARGGHRSPEPAWRLDPADVERSPAFRAGLPALAAKCGTTLEAVQRELRTHLVELRTAHVPWLYAGIVAAGRRLVASGYERIDYDAAQVERLRALLASSPAVVLSSHRSYLDGGALTVGFADHGLPALTVFAGANMAFWPIGPIWRRANAVFIRRAGTSPAYGYALRQTVAALAERRRPLQWFVEGTRSRSGLLGAPRLGLLVYVVDAYRDGRIDDAMLVPASIAYDQLREVEEYADASLGRPKKPETLGWLVRFVRAQRGRHGAIYVRFGEPVSLRAALGAAAQLPPAGTPEMRRALDELAAEVARRIEAAAPITGAALVGVALLAARGHALDDAQLRTALRGYVRYAERRGLPCVPTARLDDDATRAAVLRSFVEHGVAVEHDGTWRIAPGRELWAAYYRNSVVHHFAPAAVAELARLDVAHGVTFDASVRDLHDLFAADLHLPPLATFAAAVAAEEPDERAAVATRDAAAGTGVSGALANAVLGRAPVLCSDLMLRPLLEAHAIVANWSGGRAPADWPEDSIALAQCLAVGRRLVDAGRLRHPEAVALPLLQAALRWAKARGGPPAGLDRWLASMDEVHRLAVRRVGELLAAG